MTALLPTDDPVVLTVVALLVLASILSWAVIIEKVVRLRRLGAAVRVIEAHAAGAPGPLPAEAELARRLVAAAEDEGREGGSASELRLRLEPRLRAEAAADLRRMEGAGLTFLATVASTAPFVGLFGTVWGIMRSFGAIAAAKDTSLAAVAPGIAEALFATALGLFVAIPAVVGYNQLRAALARRGQRLAAACAGIARRWARTGSAGLRT